MLNDTDLAKRAMTQLEQRGYEVSTGALGQFKAYVQEGYEDLAGSCGYEPANDAASLGQRAAALYAMKEYTGEPALAQEYEAAATRWSEAAAREVQGSRERRRGDQMEDDAHILPRFRY